MGPVGRALIWHELLERMRDRWVIVISILFALLASGVGLYGRSAEAEVAKDYDDSERAAIAHVVGMATLKYADLMNHRTKDYVFDLDRFSSLLKPSEMIVASPARHSTPRLA